MSERSTTAWMMPLIVSLLPPAFLMSWWWVWGDDASRLSWLGWLLYWWMPLSLAFAAICVFWRLRARSASLAVFVRMWWPGFLLAVLAVLVVVWVSPPQMRVQFDETSLVGVSQNMHLQGQAVMTTGAIPFEGQPFLLESMVDKRPTLFAYLCSLVHGLTGYRIGNAFLVNSALLALGLFAVFAAAHARLGLLSGLAAPLLLLSVPLTGVVATSAGFELLAVVLLVLTTIAALGFVARPDEPRFAVMIGCGVLYAQSRYESLPIAILLSVLVWFLVRGRFTLSSRCLWLMSALPTLVTPLLLLLDHAQNPNFTPEAAGQSLFSLSNLIEHLPAFAAATFGPSLANPFPGLVACIAVVAVIVRVRAGQASRGDLLVAGPSLAITTLVLAWFYSDAEAPTAMRLFLPFAWLCALMPLAIARAMPRFGAQIVFVIGLVLAPLRLHELAEGRAFPTLDMAALTGSIDGAVDRLPSERGRTLWVGAVAQHLIIKGHAAVSVRTFQRLGSRISALQRQGDLGAVYIIETPIDRDMAPMFGEPRELLQRHSSEVVERVGGQMPITVHRLGR